MTIFKSVPITRSLPERLKNAGFDLQAAYATVADTREISRIGIFSLLAREQDPAVIAAAFDISSKIVKAHGDIAVAELINQFALDVEPPKRRLYTLAPYVRALLDHTSGRSWIYCLTSRRQLEVVETISYYKAFLNNRVKESKSCLNTI